MKAKKIKHQVPKKSQVSVKARVALDGLFRAAISGDLDAQRILGDLAGRSQKILAAFESPQSAKTSPTRVRKSKTEPETESERGERGTKKEEDIDYIDARHFNQAALAIQLLFDQSNAGNPVFTIRLTHAAAYLMDLAIRPERPNEVEEFSKLPAAAFSQEVPF